MSIGMSIGVAVGIVATGDVLDMTLGGGLHVVHVACRCRHVLNMGRGVDVMHMAHTIRVPRASAEHAVPQLIQSTNISKPHLEQQ